MVDLLSCTVMPYAWGSRTAIAELTGRPSPSEGPEAELWMGAHPMAPARITRGGGPARPLSEVIAEDAERELGAGVVAAFGPRLPFLLKVLAAAEPLSLQAHPTAEQARAGWDDEERRQVPRDAPHRNYKDAAHKPELLCALTPFDALCGFRRIEDSRALFDALAVPELEGVLAPLRASADDGSGGGARQALASTFRAIMTATEAERARAVTATVRACEAHRGRFARECALAVRLARLYPGDPGVVSALLLNLVHLEPGEAIYLGAGNLHAYLEGVGIEIMASSDNVLRGGLTKKHVDVPELMRVLDFAEGPVPPLRARTIDRDEEAWETPAAEFHLSRIRVGPREVTREVRGPEILLCEKGEVTVRPGDGTAPVVLSGGCSAFVAASSRSYALTGDGSAWRATVNLGAESAR